MRSKILPVSAAVLALGITAACGGGSGGASSAQSSTGPIKVWLSNNPEEIAWGKAMVGQWNSAHPKEKVTAQEIPAGKTSEEVIGAAITAGNAPCLVFNTSPAAVPQFEKQGGLVALDSFKGAKSYIESRSGASADQYQSPDGKFYQMPWKQNPVMIFYNKDLFKKAGINADNPPLKTYDQFLATSKKIVDSKVAQAAIWPAPSSEFFQSWFDFYPLYAAESDGKQTIENGKATFDDQAGKDVWNFWDRCTRTATPPRRSTTATPSRPEGRDGGRRSVGDRGVRRQGELGCGAGADQGRHGCLAGAHLHRREEHRPVLRLQEPADRLGRPQVRDSPRTRTASSWRRPARCRSGRTCLPPMRRTSPTPGVQVVRRPGLAHRRGAERPELVEIWQTDPRQLLSSR
jgi:hypothetical protein